MSRTKSIAAAALELPFRSARVLEFVFRRIDAAGDIYPEDPQEGVIEGRDADRILFLGERGEMSLGVRTHELSLPAFFARHRAAQTGRGVTWALAPAPSASVRQLPTVVIDQSELLRRCDVVVVMVGITDALRVMAPSAWERHMRETIGHLVQVLPRDAAILIGEIPPLNNAGSLSRPARLAAGIHGRRLNARIRLIADDYRQVTRVEFPEELTTSVWRPESEEHRYRDTYQVWGEHLSAKALDPG